MKKLMIIALILVGSLLIPAVSAIDVTSLPYTDTKVSQTFDFYQRHVVVGGTGASQGSGGLTIYMAKVQNYQNVHYASLEVDSDVSALTEGNINAFYDRPSDNSRQPCLLQVRKTRNLLGMVTKTVVYCYLQNWEVGAATGAYQSYIYKEDGSIYCFQGGLSFPIVDLTYIDGNPEYDSYFAITRGGKYNQISYVEGYSDCWHMLNLRQEKLSCAIEIIRNVDGKSYFSIIDIYDSSGLIISDAASVNADYLVGLNSLHHINITSGVNTYTYNLVLSEAPQEPSTDSTVTVYVRNSQTGAQIADSHIVISASINEEFFEVINETLTSGIYNGPLQPTGGGLPNPDYYRLIATAEGYNSIMPHIDFEVDGATTIYAYMEPTGGAPEDENNTFIDFYVRDLNANPIAGATVKFGGYTLYTNSAGYTIFEVKKDNTYTWSVSKLGYGSVTGNAVIGSNARYTVNAVIAPEVTPTTPTPIPSVTPIKPTPTLTAPSGEPVSNWLEWFAAHFGMILGGGVEIGKIFMWLCFTVPVGVYVGNRAKAGAAGFMAGAGIVTLFFVLIGWVPIWLVVLIALIIGLLYAKVYSNSDNGGGR